MTPPALRYVGRKVYLATIVILIGVLQTGVTNTRLDRLSGVLRLDRRTSARWRSWWLSAFTAMPFWRAAVGVLRRVRDWTLVAALR